MRTAQSVPVSRIEEAAAGHGHAFAPSAAIEQKAGLVAVDLEGAPAFFVGPDRPDRVVDIGDFGFPQEVGVRRDAGEVLLQIVGSFRRVDEAILNLDGRSVFLVEQA